MYNTVNKQKVSNAIWFAYIGLMLAYLLFINLQTPLIGEDYAFFSSTAKKIDLAKEIIRGVIYRFYPDNKTFNLRLGDTLSFLLLNLGTLFGIGKILFSILNAIVTILFFILIFYWSNCKLPNINSIKDLAIFSTIPILFLICSFSIGEIFFWCDGATNYLWAGTILLGIAIPYRKYFHDKNYTMKNKLIIGYTIVSYIAAFTNENTVPIIIILGGFLILRDLIKNGIKRIPIWLLLSILSMGIGYSVLIFSPNTKRRTMFYRDMFNLPENMSLEEIQNNAKRVVHSFIGSNYRFGILFIICLALFSIILNHHQKIFEKYSNIRSLFYENVFILFISSISIIALFFAPYTEIRTFLFPQIFIIILMIQINDIVLTAFSDTKYAYLPNICFCLLSLLFVYRLSFWTLDYSKFDRSRSQSIKQQLNDGEKTVIVNKYYMERNKYLNTREEGWTSVLAFGGTFYYARYHGANEILWRLNLYEEETIIIIPQNISEIQTHDISSINYNNGNLILSCGVDDPQIYLPLQEQIKFYSDEYFIEINYTNSKTGTLQVFYDFGSGLSEANSVSTIIEEIQEITKIRLPIAGWQRGGTLYMIRIDPPNGTQFEIENIWISVKGEK